MGYNPNKQVWFNPNIEYIFDTDIIEYDMKDAGFNIIKEYRLLPERTIKDLEMLGKGIDRHIAIGKMQGKDKEFSDRLSQKFAEMRAVFIDSNSLADSDIISVKKDAIFTIKECDVTMFGNIHFAEKNRYSSYIRFSNIGDIEIYYSDNGMDIKGLQYIMGHSDIEMTMQVYNHITDMSRVEKEIEKLDRMTVNL